MQKGTTPHKLPNWSIYVICLLLASIFLFIFSGNSPLSEFNYHGDYQWYMTMGNSLLAGKIPYRDLFEQKGPIVYFVAAFCCLFPDPDTMMFFVEIFSLSFFLFFAYKIFYKKLNTLLSIIAVSLLIITTFSLKQEPLTGNSIEEFALPICTYFLYCWLEFLQEKKEWTKSRCLIIGLCVGVLFWSKYTILYFILTPMIIWLVISFCQKRPKNLIINLLFLMLGYLIITLPVLLFYLLNNAIDDLFNVYFIINITQYPNTSAVQLSIFQFLKTPGIIFLFFIFWGVIRFLICNWKNKNGWLFFTSFVVNFLLVMLTCKGMTQYFIIFLPYTILGILDILEIIFNYLTISNYRKYGIAIIAIFSSFLLIYCPSYLISNYQFSHKPFYPPLAIANAINEYETQNNTKATLLYYRIGDFGIHNAAQIIPNNYFWANNYFSGKQLPELYREPEKYIQQQTSDFVVTSLNIFYGDSYLSDFYQPYDCELPNSEQDKNNISYYSYQGITLILLIKK